MHIITAIPSKIVHQSTPNVAVSIYPNPFIGETQVAIYNQLNQFNYQIIDAQGRIVLSGHATKIRTLLQQKPSTGIYWLKILNLPNIKPVLLVIE